MQDLFDQEHVMENQDELNIAAVPSPSKCSSSDATGPSVFMVIFRTT